MRGLKMPAKGDTSENVVCEVTVNVKNKDGLHMRPAMQFVDIANQFKSDISVNNGENVVDGASIMQMSMLAATYGTRLTIRAEGPDAQQAVEALRELIEERKFDEPAPGE